MGHDNIHAATGAVDHRGWLAIAFAVTTTIPEPDPGFVPSRPPASDVLGTGRFAARRKTVAVVRLHEQRESTAGTARLAARSCGRSDVDAVDLLALSTGPRSDARARSSPSGAGVLLMARCIDRREDAIVRAVLAIGYAETP
ncbi:hypothetical protein [Cellulomonas terrae]|nr:hypothetical protein [Cellulomonas terrae]